MGRRPELEQAPKQQLVDELGELRSWAPDKILSFLNEQKLHSYTHNQQLVDYLKEHRVSDHLRPERLAGPQAHYSSAPLLLDEERSNSILKGLRESGASAPKQLQILRDLPISHAQKAQYVKELDLPAHMRAELLRELPHSLVRDFELLRELPVDPLRKLEFLQQLPVPSAQKSAMLRELNLPLTESQQLNELKRVAQECNGGMLEALDKFGGTAAEKDSLIAEMKLQDFANNIVGGECAALQDVNLATGAKLDTLHEMKLMEEERRALNRRLGYPVELNPPSGQQLSHSLVNP